MKVELVGEVEDFQNVKSEVEVKVEVEVKKAKI